MAKVQAWFAMLTVIIAGNILRSKSGEPLVPALFIFGDSLADAGNNNNLTTLAKANYLPYGRAFPGSIPTGRFSNGYNSMDFLCLKLGLPIIPIYADPNTKGVNLLRGVNYASGASGIENYSGRSFVSTAEILFQLHHPCYNYLGEIIPLEDQVNNFVNTKQEIIDVLGEEGASQLISKAVFSIITANNDWLNTYLFPFSPLRVLYTVDEFRDHLINKLVLQIQKLYSNGARYFVVAGLGALGCLPSQLNRYNSNGSCIDFLNDMAQNYNEALRVRVQNLNNQLPNSTFLFNNLYTPLYEAFHNPAAYGFIYVNQACCGIGKFGGFLICVPEFPVCSNEEDYLFWDAYHTTDKMFKQMVDLMWENGPPYSYPISGKEAVYRTM